ncbi:MAG: hypothetical protein JO168_07050 [Solirubrobacterales bacterium]|nr:hypothetical protein [Solirubrobacterales bacterium]
MALRSKADVELSEELEAVAAAAAERLRAVGDGDLDRDADLQRTVGEAARHAIAAGVSLASIADAERIGHERAREELGPELLRRVERAARRRREAEREYEHAVVRAGGLGLAHRDVAAAAQVAHGTVRAIIARAQTDGGQHAASTTIAAQGKPGQQPADVSRMGDVGAEQT